MAISNQARFERAIAAIDAANAADPTSLTIAGVARPKELVHAEMLTRWVTLLRPDASEELLLAARAHHIRRWQRPRSTYPEGRSGYLRWRTGLATFHAEQAGAILAEAGYESATVARVQSLIRKRGLGTDLETQALEDGLCLVFMETQFEQLSDRVPDDRMVDVLRKTWAKMSPAGREFALALELPAHQRQLVERALA